MNTIRKHTTKHTSGNRDVDKYVITIIVTCIHIVIKLEIIVRKNVYHSFNFILIV